MFLGDNYNKVIIGLKVGALFVYHIELRQLLLVQYDPCPIIISAVSKSVIIFSVTEYYCFSQTHEFSVVLTESVNC